MTLAQWSNLFVYAAMTMYAMAMVAFAASFASSRAERGRVAAAAPVAAAVGGPSGSRSSVAAMAPPPGAGAQEELPPGRRAGNIGMALTWLAFGLLMAAIVVRALWAGRAPWGNMYEYSLASAAAMTGVFLAVSVRRDVRWMGLLVTMASLITLGVAILLLYNDSPQLVPALKSYWLVIHVAAAIIAGGAFTVGAAATVLYLLADRAERDALRVGAERVGAERVGAQDDGGAPAGGPADDTPDSLVSRIAARVAVRVPDSQTLDTLAYRVNAFVFPLWTFAVVAGAIWAEDAWGRYWGWDPKETWAFITWLLYAGYLHARATAGWRGRKAAVLGLVGFAAFLVNFFGVNLFVSGLHSYAGV